MPTVVGALTAALLPMPGSAGPSGGALPPALVRILDVTALAGVPADAKMVAVNITAVGAADRGYFAAYPCDADTIPTASNVNYLPDQAVPNLALTRIAKDGTICITTSQIADLIVDVIGYVPNGSNITALPIPHRVTDTRDTTRLQPDNILRVPIHGTAGIATDTTVVMANVTAISHADRGYLSVFPCADTTPNTSSLNYGPGQTRANFVTSRIGDNGHICITTSQPTDVIVDLAATATTGIHTLPQPLRIADTRDHDIQVSKSLDLDVIELADLPTDTVAAIYNLTAVNPTQRGYATSHACLTTPPWASNLNYLPGQATANTTITRLTDTGHLCINVSQTTDLIVDLIAYTTDEIDYVPITPARIHDTRDGWQTICDKALVAPYNGPPLGDETRTELELVDLRNGDRRPIPGIYNSQRNHTTLSADCSAVYQLAPPEGDIGSRVERISLATGARTVVRSPGPDVMFLSIAALADGRVVVWTRSTVNYPGGSFIDVHSGETLVEFGDPNADEPALWPEIDASLRYLIYVENGELLVWDLDTLELLYVDQSDASFHLSPDGLYIARSRTKDGWRVCEILTRYGELVDEFQIAPFSSVGHADCHWAAPGVLYANSTDSTTLRHQLFGSTAPLTQLSGEPLTPWVTHYR